jgi:N-acetyl sugar amidotransferase
MAEHPSSDQPLEAKYGLPSEVVFCKRCVISNQRPNSTNEYAHTKTSKKATIHFDEHGVCDACRVAEMKSKIDWDERERELIDLCNRFRRNDGRYDCIVPGSGGKDSFYQAHVLKYKYGMHPLTVTWAPHIYTPWGWDNFQSWIGAGFDNNLVTPNRRVHRLLTRLAVERLFHPFQPFILGQKAMPARLSTLYDIPLIFYGEDEAEYGNPRQDAASAQRSWDYFTSGDKSKVFIAGTSVEELKEGYGLHENDLEIYYPANPELMRRTGTEIHYLGYYLRWHPQGAYYYAQKHGGFRASPERTPGTFSKYSSIDDKMDDFHFYTTFIKFGIGHATHDAAQEVRSGEINREEAVALVRRFDGEWPQRFADELFSYLSIPESEFPVAAKRFENPLMSREYFDQLTDNARSPHLWVQDHGKWALRHTVYANE